MELNIIENMKVLEERVIMVLRQKVIRSFLLINVLLLLILEIFLSSCKKNTVYPKLDNYELISNYFLDNYGDKIDTIIENYKGYDIIYYCNSKKNIVLSNIYKERTNKLSRFQLLKNNEILYNCVFDSSGQVYDENKGVYPLMDTIQKSKDNTIPCLFLGSIRKEEKIKMDITKISEGKAYISKTNLENGYFFLNLRCDKGTEIGIEITIVWITSKVKATRKINKNFYVR